MLSLLITLQTELCRSWEEFGSCRYGIKCQFAHSREELRPVNRHPKYKTEVCDFFIFFLTFFSLGKFFLKEIHFP